MKDPVIVAGRNHRVQLALRSSREICEIVLRDQQARRRIYSYDVVDRAAAAAAAVFFDGPHAIADAIEAEFLKSEMFV